MKERSLVTLQNNVINNWEEEEEEEYIEQNTGEAKKKGICCKV